MARTEWEEFENSAVKSIFTNSGKGISKEITMLRAVIDPKDRKGFKNLIIDRIQWTQIKKILTGSKRLLDFGCGVGRLASRISNMGIDYTGMDQSSYMIELAKELNKPSVFNFIQSDSHNMPFEDGSFDTCVAIGVFEFIAASNECDRVLAEIERVLSPGGRLIVISQASLSNQFSPGVMRVLKEDDYSSALSRRFHLKSLKRVRLCQFSRLTRGVIFTARYLPRLFPLIVEHISRMELRRAERADETLLSGVEYYDILIEAQK